MSVQSEIDRLNAIKERIRTNLVAQGIEVPSDTMLSEMAEMILSVAGEDGTSVTITDITESNADGGSNVVTFSDGKVLTIKNGTKGSKGDTGDPGVPVIVKSITKTGSVTTVVFEDVNGETEIEISDGAPGADGKDGAAGKDGEKGEPGTPGADGKTPVKGTDYFTPEEVEDIAGIAASKVQTSERLKSDWNVNDPTAPEYVNNRTHWTEGGTETPYVYEKTVTAANEYLSDQEILVKGGLYRVLQNGVEFTFTAQEYTDMSGVKRVYCGNSAVLNGDYENDSVWDVSFAVINVEDGTVFRDVMLEKGFAQSVIVSLYGTVETVHPLDEKYIPDTIARKSDITGGGATPDWSINDPDAPGYVKNRTHWEEVAEIEVFPLSDVAFENSEGYLSESSALLTEGKTYKVSWNGIEYTCEAQSAAMEFLEGMPAEFIGNGSIAGLPDTGEPFMILSVNYPEHEMVVTMALDYTGELTSAPVGIWEVSKTVHKLDLKFVDLPCYDTRVLELLYENDVYVSTSASLNGLNLTTTNDLTVTFNGKAYFAKRYSDGIFTIWGNPHLVGNLNEDNGLPFAIYNDFDIEKSVLEVVNEYCYSFVSLKIEEIVSGEIKQLNDALLPIDVARKSDVVMKTFKAVEDDELILGLSLNLSSDAVLTPQNVGFTSFGLTVGASYRVIHNDAEYNFKAERYISPLSGTVANNLDVDDAYIGAYDANSITPETPFGIESYLRSNGRFGWSVILPTAGKHSIKIFSNGEHIRPLPAGYIPALHSISMVSSNGTVYKLTVTNDGTLKVD